MTNEELIEKVARVIASHTGPEWDSAFASKLAWRQTLGQQEGKNSDVNGPFQEDYLDAARAVIKIVGAELLNHQIGGYPAVSTHDIRSLTQGKDT